MHCFLRWGAGVLGALACLHLGAGPAEAERRVALSVGIDRYDNLEAKHQLQKAVNDARAVGAALTELGFQATIKENLSLDEFNDAWASFLNRLEPGDTAAFFFAGHGVQVQGGNYLVPRSVPKVEDGKEKVLVGASIRFSDLRKELHDRGVRVSIFILDACRENPFPARKEGAHTRFVGGGGARGLTREEAVAVKGSFILYSADYEEKALDRLSGADGDANSPYTRTLIPILKTPGLSLPEIARRVRGKVAALARTAQPPHDQTPAYYDGVVGDFVLAPRAGAPASAGALSAEVAQVCQSVAANPSLGVVQSLLEVYRGTPAARCIEARIRELQQTALATPSVKTPPPPPLAAFNPSRAAAPLTAAEERALKPKDSFKECADCPEMVVVPAGSFTMGSPTSEEGRSDSEGPQRKVTIARPFAVGKFEVTFAEWDACLAEGGCRHRPDDSWGRGKQPVMRVSWDDITKEYLPWLSRKTGKTYRLLSEAEWDYVARAGTSTPFWWGSSISPGQANYDGNYTYGGGSKGEYRQKTVPVDSFAANPWGLYNVHGNVWEWVQDCWNDNYNGAPSDGSAWTTGDCSRRVLRGGSWFNFPGGLRSAVRGRFTTDNRYYDFGFRVGRTF